MHEAVFFKLQVITHHVVDPEVICNQLYFKNGIKLNWKFELIAHNKGNYCENYRKTFVSVIYMATRVLVTL